MVIKQLATAQRPWKRCKLPWSKVSSHTMI